MTEQNRRRSLDSSDSSTVLRLAKPTDIAGVLLIQDREDYRPYIGQWSADELQGAIADPALELAVAADRTGAVLGFYLLCDLGNKDRSVNLLRLAVAVPGQGVGGRLLRCAQQRAFTVHHAHRLWLDVFTTNARAEAIYKSFGWVEEGVLRDAKFRHGSFQSQRILSMLENEYKDRYR